MEFSISLKQLSELRAFSLGKIKPEKKFFVESLRGTNNDLMYKNFTSFEREDNIEMAFYLMGLAFKERPNGPFIKERFFKYKNILDVL